jgi:hypothetical protein
MAEWRLRRRVSSDHGHAAAAARTTSTGADAVACAAAVARGAAPVARVAAVACRTARLRRCRTAAALGDTTRTARARSGGGLIRKRDLNVRLKRLRSAFRAMTGRGGRMTGHGGAAFGHSPVSSWNDRTRPVRHDQTLTESGHRLPEKLKRMTGGGGGHRDRTRWSATTRPVQRPVTDPGEVLWDDRMCWWSPEPDTVVKQHRVRCSVRCSVRSLFNAFLQFDLRCDFYQSSSNSKRLK